MKTKGLEVYAWCIMTSHVHMIVASSKNPIEKTVGEMKSFTSTQLRKAIKENAKESRREWMLWMMERASQKSSNTKGFQFWQHNNKPLELITNEFSRQKLEYLHNNPVEAGFVSRPEDYLYSSARDYAGEKGLLEELMMMF